MSSSLSALVGRRKGPIPPKQQVCDEFRRNRENKIKDALKRFKESKFTVQLPSFMKGYEEYDSIRLLIAACK